MKFEIHSIEETQKFAQKIARLCQGKTVLITLDGDLGAGKTTWTKAFGKALGVKNTINSPTFTILKSYKQADGKPLHHIDAYRLEGLEEQWNYISENRIIDGCRNAGKAPGTLAQRQIELPLFTPCAG